MTLAASTFCCTQSPRRHHLHPPPPHTEPCCSWAHSSERCSPAPPLLKHIWTHPPTGPRCAPQGPLEARSLLTQLQCNTREGSTCRTPPGTQEAGHFPRSADNKRGKLPSPPSLPIPSTVGKWVWNTPPESWHFLTRPQGKRSALPFAQCLAGITGPDPPKRSIPLLDALCLPEAEHLYRWFYHDHIHVETKRFLVPMPVTQPRPPRAVFSRDTH